MEYYQTLQDAYGAVPVKTVSKPQKRKLQTSSVVERVMQALPIDPGNGMGGGAEYEPFVNAVKYTAPVYNETPPDQALVSKLNYAIQMLERKSLGSEPTGTHDVILYSFTGIFMLFVLDNFVRLGHKIEQL